ncbi:MAG TPA: hypothetical protein VGY58_17320, partial [Gemmataceae bacterium]|nr:hypothetical protein [Gemmataceae bacterium]
PFFPNAPSELEALHKENGPQDGSIPKAVLRHCPRFVHIPLRHCLKSVHGGSPWAVRVARD